LGLTQFIGFSTDADEKTRDYCFWLRHVALSVERGFFGAGLAIALKTSGRASFKNISLAGGIPPLLQAVTEGGLISQSRAVADVPPISSIIRQAS